MGFGLTLSIEQLVRLSGLDEASVRRAIRRGDLPSQEPEVVREWLKEVFARDRRPTSLIMERRRG